jgi:hypothetical protein
MQTAAKIIREPAVRKLERANGEEATEANFNALGSPGAPADRQEEAMANQILSKAPGDRTGYEKLFVENLDRAKRDADAALKRRQSPAEVASPKSTADLIADRIRREGPSFFHSLPAVTRLRLLEELGGQSVLDKLVAEHDGKRPSSAPGAIDENDVQAIGREIERLSELQGALIKRRWG